MMTKKDKEKKQAFAEIIRVSMNGLSIEKTADITGISHEYIRRMRNGHIPSEDVIDRFASGLDIDSNPIKVIAGYEQPIDTVTAVEYALNGAEDLSALAKDQLMQMVREFAKKHKIKSEE